MLAQGCLTPPDIHPKRSLFVVLRNKFYRLIILFQTKMRGLGGADLVLMVNGHGTQQEIRVVAVGLQYG
jgi:hypothetical protein